MRKIYLLPALFACLIFLAAPPVSPAAVFVSIRIAPPLLPVYVQPPCPVDGYIWVPGYWAYGEFGYYWVPGVWVAPPEIGFLWTPPWWGFEGGFYGFHPGYWGPQVGFYGGIDYGFGYSGVGYDGGRWQGGRFAYNTAVTRVKTTVIHDTYRAPVNNYAFNHNLNNGRTSFNGPGGVNVRPTAQQTLAERQRHIAATPTQVAHERAFSADRGQLASVNHGRPATLATARPIARTNPRAANNRPAGNVGRPGIATRSEPQRRAVSAPRPAIARVAARPEPQPRAVSAPRPAVAPRVAARPEPQRRAASAPRPAIAPRVAARPEPQRRAVSAPRPAIARAAPRPAPVQRAAASHFAPHAAPQQRAAARPEPHGR